MRTQPLSGDLRSNNAQHHRQMGNDAWMSDVEPARIVGQPDERAVALHQLVGLDPPAYRRADVGRLAGIQHQRSVKWWRAMGFPAVPDDVEAVTEADIELVRRLAALAVA